MNEESGKKNGTHIHQGDNLQFVGPRQQVKITENEQ